MKLIEAYQDLYKQVETMLYYLEAQDTGPFDPNPLMLQKADKDVKTAYGKVKKLLDAGCEQD